MAIDDSIRDFADAYDTDAQTVKLRLGTVATVTAGASLDGVAAVSVTVDGSTFPAPYLASYSSPTVADLVSVLLVNHAPLILGRVIGLPSF
jgi:hypothetical protein